MGPGQYPQPLQRTNFVFAFLLNGYCTARMEVQAPYTASGTNWGTWGTLPDWSCTGVFENLDSKNSVTVQLKETASVASGPRTNLGSPITLAPSGHITQAFNPTASFVEVWCSGGGPAQLRWQVSSKIGFTLEGFQKYPTQDPTYPWQTEQGSYPPVAWPGSGG